MGAARLLIKLRPPAAALCAHIAWPSPPGLRFAATTLPMKGRERLEFVFKKELYNIKFLAHLLHHRQGETP
ncbi:hypothetical protein D1604_13855 [Brevundimonas sp. LPMIX5]|nr:hypothetical protein D1604_13855 [Brevundimonas sp. LPMIX5]